MHFDNTLLSAGDQAALTAAQAAIPAVLTSLSDTITTARATGAAALTLSAQLAALETERQTLLANGQVEDGPQFHPIFAQKREVALRLLTAEQDLGGTRQALFAACQACAPVLSALLPLAQRQAVTTITAALAPFYNGNPNLLQTTVLGTPFISGLNGRLQVPSLATGTVAEAVVTATVLQTLLTNVEAGTDFYTF